MRALVTEPPFIYFSATSRAYKNPEHAADKSKAATPGLMPSADCTKQAVDGNVMSEVTVPTITRSISLAATPEDLSAARAAFTAISVLVSPAETRRSLMPVRVKIHSSVVSTIPSRSRLVTTLLGT